MKESNVIFEQVSQKLNIKLPPSSLESHYQLSEENFRMLPGVLEQKTHARHNAREFIVVTGENTHYFRMAPTVSNCLYHDWKEAKRAGVATPEQPILTPTTQSPLSFFKSGQHHHCSHLYVYDAKAECISSEIRTRSVLRSGQDGAAFCEIFSFEEHRCCRVCVFEEVCIMANVFSLPCCHGPRKMEGMNAETVNEAGSALCMVADAGDVVIGEKRTAEIPGSLDVKADVGSGLDKIERGQVAKSGAGCLLAENKRAPAFHWG